MPSAIRNGAPLASVIVIVIALLASLPASAFRGLDTLYLQKRVSLIGFSPDGSAVAFRAYALVPEDDGMDPGAEELRCKGYIDDEGKPFLGEMAIVIKDDGGTLVLPVFDWDGEKGIESCTSFEVAKKRLTDAKAELAARKIDPKGKAGTTHKGDKDVVDWPGCGRLRLEKKVVGLEQEGPDGVAEERRYRGNVHVQLESAGAPDKKERQASFPVDATQSLIMSSWVGWTLPLAFVSPSKTHALAFVREEHGSMRGGSDRYFTTPLMHCSKPASKPAAKAAAKP